MRHYHLLMTQIGKTIQKEVDIRLCERYTIERA